MSKAHRVIFILVCITRQDFQPAACLASHVKRNLKNLINSSDMSPGKEAYSHQAFAAKNVIPPDLWTVDFNNASPPPPPR